MEYELFNDFESFEDEESKFCGHYIYKGNKFIIEPNFYTQLLGMKEHHLDKFDLIFKALLEVVEKNKRVIFTADYEFPACYKDDYIYREITDITDPLLIFVEDKSRGSDYGD